MILQKIQSYGWNAPNWPLKCFFSDRRKFRQKSTQSKVWEYQIGKSSCFRLKNLFCFLNAIVEMSVNNQPWYRISLGKNGGDLMPWNRKNATQARSREDVTGTRIWNLELDGYPRSCIFGLKCTHLYLPIAAIAVDLWQVLSTCLVHG